MELNGKASISKTTPNIINAFFIVSLFGSASYEKGLRKTRMKMAMISCNPQPATIFENHFFNVGGVGEGMEKAGSLFGVGLPLGY
jgi:hypothetical protein